MARINNQLAFSYARINQRSSCRLSEITLSRLRVCPGTMSPWAKPAPDVARSKQCSPPTSTGRGVQQL